MKKNEPFKIENVHRQVESEMLLWQQKICRKSARKLIALVLATIIIPPGLLISAFLLCWGPVPLPVLLGFISKSSFDQIRHLLPQLSLFFPICVAAYLAPIAIAIIRGWLCRRNKKQKNRKIRLGYILAAALTLLALILVRTEWAAAGTLLGSILLLVLIPILCVVLLTALSWFFKPLADAIFFLFSERKRLRANDGVWAEAESSLMTLYILCYRAGQLSFYCLLFVSSESIGEVLVFGYQSLQIMMCSIG
jgi:hypothetical protein